MVPREDGVFGGGGVPLRVLRVYASMQRPPTGAGRSPPSPTPICSWEGSIPVTSSEIT